MELQDNVLSKWPAPECPFTVQYSPRVLDDIRLAVTDAFFSLPRGGVEMGGLLLGRQDKGGVTILDSMPVECEHAFGPSFVLSDRDHAKLSELIAAAGKNPQVKVLGWWHSHTRSEIFLSEADQKIHNSFFPEPWQVALVLKPHTFQPTRAGFFFRENDGAIHATASYHEIVLQPLPMRPAGPVEPPPAAPGRPAPAEEVSGRVINVTAAPPDPPAAEPETEPAPVEIPPPNFLTGPASEPGRSRGWIGWVAAAIGVALAIAGYSTRDRWAPALQASVRPAPAQSIGLNVIDHDGQLQIRWNGDAAPVRSASSGNLLILDGSATATVPLDAPHVQSGAFTYTRKSDRVDVTLAVAQSNGKETRVATLFNGAPPRTASLPAPAAPDDNVVREERDALREQNASLKADLARQMERNRALEKALDEMRKVVQREQQRKRLEVQSPDAAK